MSKLVYITNTSLDGYVEDANGAIDWSNPEQIFDFITGLLQPFGTYLCGRRMYETMAYWDVPDLDGYPPEQREFTRVWQKAQKIVFSKTLAQTPVGYARVERDFDRDTIEKLKRESTQDITVGGATLAGLALEAGLVDECHLFVHPVVLGGGKPAFAAGLRRNLQLLETRRFDTGVVYLHYGVRHG